LTSTRRGSDVGKSTRKLSTKCLHNINFYFWILSHGTVIIKFYIVRLSQDRSCKAQKFTITSYSLHYQNKTVACTMNQGPLVTAWFFHFQRNGYDERFIHFACGSIQRPSK
jgi:hypothetical protein